MIRINLLKTLQTPAQTTQPITKLVEPPNGSGRRALVALLILLIAGMSLYLAVYFFKAATRPKPAPLAPVAQAVSAPEPTHMVPTPPKPVEPAVDSTAKISVDTVSPVPASSILHLLGDLEAAATAGIGFSSVEFTPPGEFKVHGVASSESDLKHFHDALATAIGMELKEDRVQTVGTDPTAREFFFAGQTHYAVATADIPGKAVLSNLVEVALRNFASLAKEHKVDLEALQLSDSSLVDGIRRMTYHGTARCDYDQMQALLAKLRKAKSNFEFRSFALEARGDEKMLARFDLILFVK